jgi:hypothetical protein
MTFKQFAGSGKHQFLMQLMLTTTLFGPYICSLGKAMMDALGSTTQLIMIMTNTSNKQNENKDKTGSCQKCFAQTVHIWPARQGARAD